MPNDLPVPLSVAALKLRMDKQRSTDDPLLSEYLSGALKQAQAPAPFGCGRLLIADPALQLDNDGVDQSEPVAKTFKTRGRRVYLPDARDIVSVMVDGVLTTEYDTLEIDGLTVRLELPHERYMRGYDRDYDFRWLTRRRKTVVVTGRFGFAAVPEDLAEGIYVLAARKFYEKDAQYADQVVVAEGSAAAQVYYRNLPPPTRIAFGIYTLPKGVIGLGLG